MRKRSENPSHNALRMREWRIPHPEYQKEYRQRPEARKKKAEYARRYNERHPAKAVEARKRWIEYGAKVKRDRRDILDAYKHKPCADCYGWFPPYVMDFDHRSPEDKLDTVSNMASNAIPLDLLYKEIAKCDVVCANCHRERTYKQHQAGVI